MIPDFTPGFTLARDGVPIRIADGPAKGSLRYFWTNRWYAEWYLGHILNSQFGIHVVEHNAVHKKKDETCH